MEFTAKFTLALYRQTFCESTTTVNRKMMRIHGKIWFLKVPKKRRKKNVLKTQSRALKIAISREIRLTEKFLNFYTAC